MRTYFRREECPSCHDYHDPTEMTCPKCGHADPSRRDFHAFDHHVRDGIGWQLGYFLIQLVGFQILGVVISLVPQIAFTAGHPHATQEEISAFMKSVEVNFSTTAIAYLLVVGAYFLIFLLRHRLKRVFESFKNPKSYLWGAIGGVALIVFQIGYTMAVEAIFKATGHAVPGVNGNETAIRKMCQAFPVLCVIMFGIVGPFTEEIGYRVGLFGFCSRLGKVFAYVLSAIVFGFIHFNFEAFLPDKQALLPVEFANLPAYIIPGVGLAFLYDRFGLAASVTAHTLNNLTSIITTIIRGGNAGA